MRQQQFIIIIDRLFDFLNSRTLFGKGFKKPVYLKNISIFNRIIADIIDYLFTLEDKNGNFLHKRNRKTFIIGFALAAKSVLEISPEILKSNLTFKYILTYKFSQDHLELFFFLVLEADMILIITQMLHNFVMR